MTEPSDSPPFAAPIDQRYLGDALAATLKAAQADPTNDVLQTQLQTLQTQANLLESDHLRRAAQYWQNNQLGAALSELDVGLLTLNNSTILQRRRAYYRELLDRRLQSQRDELLVTRARYVADTLRVQKQIQALAPNDAISSREIAALQQERNEMGAKLLSAGNNAATRGQLPLALQALNLASDLGEQGAKNALTQLQTHEMERQVVRKAIAEDNEQTVLETKRVQMMAVYQNAFQLKDLPTCRDTLGQLMQLFPADGTWQLWKDTLMPVITARVRGLQEDGARLYRNGDIAAAQSNWKQALILQPENTELVTLVERAERVLNNLKSLEKH